MMYNRNLIFSQTTIIALVPAVTWAFLAEPFRWWIRPRHLMFPHRHRYFPNLYGLRLSDFRRTSHQCGRSGVAIHHSPIPCSPWQISTSLSLDSIHDEPKTRTVDLQCPLYKWDGMLFISVSRHTHTNIKIYVNEPAKLPNEFLIKEWLILQFYGML